MTQKYSVCVLGATGIVGQQFVNLLKDHPWFEITELLASKRSAGKKYGQIMQDRWKLPSSFPSKFGQIIVGDVQTDTPSTDLVFSALDSSVAYDIEQRLAKKGLRIFSNVKSFRNHPKVPIIIPEINSDHLECTKFQDFDPNNKGFIVTNPNCSLQATALSLFPIDQKFGLQQVGVVTMQAISGAGYPGVASLDILDNIVPFIDGEEEKIEKETLKIYSSFRDGEFVLPQTKISASCNRVPVVNGHLSSISFSTGTKATPQQILQAWKDWQPKTLDLRLPSAVKPIEYFQTQNRPQPKLDRMNGGGMAISVGRLRQDNLLDFKFTALVNNLVRGASGGAILNAEMYALQYL